MSFTSLVTTMSWSRASNATWPSMTSVAPAAAQRAPTGRDTARSRPCSLTPRSRRANNAWCGPPPRQACATQPDDVTTCSRRRRAASSSAATARSPRSKAISAPLSRTTPTHAAPRRRFVPRSSAAAASATSASLRAPYSCSQAATASPSASSRSRSRAASASQAETDWSAAAAEARIAAPNSRSNDTLIFSTPTTAAYQGSTYQGRTTVACRRHGWSAVPARKARWAVAGQLAGADLARSTSSPTGRPVLSLGFTPGTQPPADPSGRHHLHEPSRASHSTITRSARPRLPTWTWFCACSASVNTRAVIDRARVSVAIWSPSWDSGT